MTLSRPSLLRNGWSCTSTTLAQRMALYGYPEAARTLVPSFMTESGLSTESSEESPMEQSIRQLIHDYMNATQWIRCSHLAQRQTLLLRHIQNEEWLLQRIGPGEQHEFIYIKQQEMPWRIAQFYRLPTNPLAQSRECRLTVAMFDRLCVPEQIDQFPRFDHLPHDEEDFQHLIDDLQCRQQSTLDHISQFTICNNKKHHTLQNIVFFLPSTGGVWIAQRDDQTERPIVIRLYSHEDWLSLLEVICGGRG